uniref:Uncharacterized protein n=1 Tax=Leersia perrieri TaxID=77586 RepID=A0A0D9WQZ9_9ORYZ
MHESVRRGVTPFLPSSFLSKQLAIIFTLSTPQHSQKPVRTPLKSPPNSFLLSFGRRRNKLTAASQECSDELTAPVRALDATQPPRRSVASPLRPLLATSRRAVGSASSPRVRSHRRRPVSSTDGGDRRRSPFPLSTAVDCRSPLLRLWIDRSGRRRVVDVFPPKPECIAAASRLRCSSVPEDHWVSFPSPT